MEILSACGALKMNMRKIIILISLACLVALSISSVQASNENVTLQSADHDTLNSQIPVDGSADEIAKQIEKAEDGDIVDLGENRQYNINNDSITISKKITLKGSNVTITSKSSEGGLRLQGNDITILGITFKNPVEPQEDSSILSGKAIYAKETSNLVIDGCQFINYECGIDILDSNNTTIKNCSFTNTTLYGDNVDQIFPIFEEIPSELEVFCEDQTNLNTTGKISKKIKLLAKQIVGKTKGIEAVKKLAIWVSKNIVHETAEGFYQSPLTTLQRKLGNCCCHSELFLQLCASLGYTNQFDMYIVHVGTMEFGKRHFFTVVGNLCVDTDRRNPWGRGGGVNKQVYSITKYPYLPLIRKY